VGVRYLGYPVTPDVVNRRLDLAGGFGGDSGNLMIFGKADEAFGVKLIHAAYCTDKPAPMDLVAASLIAGRIVIAEIDFTPGGKVNSHWVRLLPTADQEANLVRDLQADCLIMDPWMPPGEEVRWLMPAYADKSWPNPARAIMRLVIYEPPAARSSAAVGDVSLAAQPVLHRSPMLY